jgi:cytochrome P450
LEKRLDTTGPTFKTRILFTDRVITFEPSHIKALLATQFEDFDKGRDTVTTLNSLLGSGVFAVDGDLWKFHRGITRPFFSKDRITHFDIFDRHADVAIGKMKARFKEGYAVDFQDVVSRFTLDSATEFLFGHDIGTLSDPLPYPFFHSSNSGSSSSLSQTQTFSARFSRSFSDAQSSTAFRSRFGEMWPLVEFWKDKTKEKIKPIHEFLEPIMKEGVRRRKEAEAKAKESGVEVKESETVLDHLIHYTDDPILLRDEILNLAVAGRDTTASLLSFTTYMLSQHPDILRRLREEILTTIGPSRRPTYDDLRDMKYLRAVLNETLRLYPVVPFNMRQSNKHTTLPPIKPG